MANITLRNISCLRLSIEFEPKASVSTDRKERLESIESVSSGQYLRELSAAMNDNYASEDLNITEGSSDIPDSGTPSLPEFECIHCGRGFVKRYMLNKHMIMHPPSYTCPSCDAHFPKQKDRDSHILNHHATFLQGSERVYCCPHSACQRRPTTFRRLDNLRRHLRVLHNHQ